MCFPRLFEGEGDNGFFFWEGGGAADAPNYGLRYDTLANMGVYLYDGKILTY